MNPISRLTGRATRKAYHLRLPVRDATARPTTALLRVARLRSPKDATVVARPGAQHLARTAAEVEYSGSRFQAQRRAKSGKLFGRKRVMDAVSAFGDVVDTRDIHAETPYVCKWIQYAANSGLTLKLVGGETAGGECNVKHL